MNEFVRRVMELIRSTTTHWNILRFIQSNGLVFVKDSAYSINKYQ